MSSARPNFLICKRFQNGKSTFATCLQVIMSEKEVRENFVVLEAVSQRLHGSDTHPIVTHENLLNIDVLLQSLGYRTNLLIRQDILYQIQISQRQQLEQIS